MALPDLYLFYLAGQLKYLGPWTSTAIPVAPESHLASHEYIHLVAHSRKSTVSQQSLLPIHKVAQKAWSEAKSIAQYYDIPA